MRASGSRRWWRVGLALIIVLLVLSSWWWPRERLLLQRATRVADINNRDRDHPFWGWVSDHEFLRLHWLWPIDAAHLPSITRYDVRTGRAQSFAVTKAVASTHGAILPSPDGRWALCWDGDYLNPRSHAKVTAMNLQTGRYLAWPSGGDPYHYENLWMADSRRWLHATTLPDGYLTVFNLDAPAKPLRLSLPSYGDLRWKEYMLTTQDHLLVYGEEIDDSNPAKTSGWTVREYRLLPHVARLHTLYVRPPAGQQTGNPVFSPSGERIAWSCLGQSQSALAAWLHRWLHLFPAAPQTRLSLWISRLDGSHAHEIGHIAVSGEESETLDPRWLPGSKRISFSYKGTLYTVPAY